MSTGSHLDAFKVEGSNLRSVAVSPDNSFIAIGTSKTVELWNLQAPLAAIARQPVRNRVLTGHKFQIQSVAYSPDGKWLASSSVGDPQNQLKGTVKLWNAEDGTEAWSQDVAGGTQALVFTPDSKNLVAASSTIQFLDLSGKLVRTLVHQEGNNAEGTHVSILAISEGLLASGADSGSIKLWNLADGKVLKTIDAHPNNNQVKALHFSPDGTMLASGGMDDQVRLWSVPKGTHLATLSGHTNWIQSLAFSPSGKLLASGSVFDSAKLWDLNIGKERVDLKPDIAQLTFADFGDGGRTLVLAGSTVATDGLLGVWDVETGTQLTCVTWEDGLVWGMAMHPKRNTVAIAAGKDLHVWSLKVGKDGHGNP